MKAPKAPTRIVGIGASAGGLEAFTELVRHLPEQSDLAFVLVQHLDPTHRSLLSELLGRAANLPVQEITDKVRAEPNRIYVIPPNTNLSVDDGVLRLTPRAKNDGPARSIDHFLKSLASDQGAEAIGVVLSGAGSDGAKGLKAIKDAGGYTFAQDAETSKYDSMPRSAVATGCVDFVLPPDRIAAELARIVDRPSLTKRRAADNARKRAGTTPRNAATELPPEDVAPWPKDPADADLRRVFALLRQKHAVDFGVYRINTIRRRLTRRLQALKLKGLAAYLKHVREQPAELDELYQDLLIGVTHFFRNPSVFETLKRQIFPRLVRHRGEGEALRLWIAGCSTGQEAYSFAIAFTEFCEKAKLRPAIQIFATDVNPRALEIARAGRYAPAQLEGLNAARLQRYFSQEGDGYRVQKSIRDLVVFAQQNLLVDPPFTRVDLISCRNMLIYVEPALQQKVIPTFHYALRPDGFLVLGTSESIGAFTHLFSTEEKSQKIYQRKATAGRTPGERTVMGTAVRPAASVAPAAPKREAEFNPHDAYREADRLTLSRYAPAGVLVNEHGEILQFRGKVQPFLEIPSGRATFNLFKMARGGLALAVQKALQRARADNRAVREKAVSLDGRQRVNLEVIPYRSAGTRCFLVVFEKPARAAKAPVAEKPAAAGAKSDASADRGMASLKREYAETRDHLVTLREQHETAVEELQASNEEVQSSNEELQSLNEELETSNEELESANEELTTLNEELATRNVELRESEQRLREQAQLVELAPLLARSPKDRIIFWNRGAEQLYGFTKDEALGQTSHLLLGAKYNEPLETIQAHLQRHGRWDGEVAHQRKDGTALTVAAQWVAHHDEHGKLTAVLEVYSDITARKQAEEALRQAQELNQRILASTPDCIVVCDLAGRVLFVNSGADLGVTLGTHWSSLWSAEARPAADASYREALTGSPASFQATTANATGAVRWWDVVMQPIRDASGMPEQLLVVCRNVTDRMHAELMAKEEARLASLRAEIALQVARGGDLTPILQQVAQIVVHHTEAESVRLWLASDTHSMLRLVASAGLFVHLNQPHSQVMIGEGRVGGIAASKRIHTTHQVASDPTIGDPDWARREGLTSFAGYPLLFESKLLGVMAVLSRRRLEPRQLRELGLAADALALLIQRKQSDDDRSRLLQEATDARNAALAASRAKDEFLAALSHELRTPLNPVLLLASDGAEDPSLPAPVRATFETIRNNISLEAKLIEDLLDLTRIAHGKLELEMQPVDVNEALTDAVRIVSANVERDAVTFEQDLTPGAVVVRGDSVRLQQIFWNLLNNALKFTPRGGRITVATKLLSDHRVRVRISDTGIGIRPADLDQIFDAFKQVERRQGGLGLGLAISRQLVEKHHGTIRAMSDGPGKGATFHIDLPLIAPAAGAKHDGVSGHPTHAATSAPTGHGNGNDSGNGHGNGNGHRPGRTAAIKRAPATGPRRRLLLIEDHASTRTALRAVLTNRNYDVAVAGSLAEARLRIQDADYDVVLSDLGLPDGDGYELLAELRAARPSIIAIALSGYGAEDDRERSRAAGFVSHLTKPVSIDALEKIIAEALDGRAAK